VFALEDEDEAAYWGHVEGLRKSAMAAIGEEMAKATQVSVFPGSTPFLSVFWRS
jgi:hypothetical protein